MFNRFEKPGVGFLDMAVSQLKKTKTFVDDVELATLEWVDWFNNRGLLEPIGNSPPAELEQAYYQNQEAQAMVA